MSIFDRPTICFNDYELLTLWSSLVDSIYKENLLCYLPWHDPGKLYSLLLTYQKLFPNSDLNCIVNYNKLKPEINAYKERKGWK
jgi:hypothetical protein